MKPVLKISLLLFSERESERHETPASAAHGPDLVDDGQVVAVADGRPLRDVGEQDPAADGREPSPEDERTRS